MPSKPEGVYQATYRAFEASAKGLIVSREHDEMKFLTSKRLGGLLRMPNVMVFDPEWLGNRPG